MRPIPGDLFEFGPRVHLSARSLRNPALQALQKRWDAFSSAVAGCSLHPFLLFLAFVILLCRRRRMCSWDGEGPINSTREDLIEGEGGLAGGESNWIEFFSESERRTYLRAKGTSAISNSVPIDIQLNPRVPRLSSGRLVVRTGHRSHTFATCPCPGPNHTPTRPLLSFLCSAHYPN